MTILAQDGRGFTAQVIRPGVTQTVSVTGVSAAVANAVTSRTKIIRVVCTSDCHYRIGATPTATTSDPFLPANVVEYVGINSGQKIAFIQNSANGTAYVTETK